MNEAANFVEGQKNDAQIIEDSLTKTMTLRPGNKSPNVKSLQVDAYHNDDKAATEYNYHSLFGHQQGIATAKIFEDAAERTFIISRSTFAGSGKYVSKWLGDNHSNYESMKTTTAGIMLFNTFGFSLVGGDICGFMDQTTAELCTRWTVIGAFYPFARNHNGLGEDAQEPYRFEGDDLATMKRAIEIRYELIRYMYQWMWKANVNGGTVWRPQSAEFPADQTAYENPEMNPMIGDSIKLALSYDEVTSKNFYFPNGATWIHLFEPTNVINGGNSQDVTTEKTSINAYLRQDKVVQWSYPTHIGDGSLNTADLVNAPVVLKQFHTGRNGVATGDIVLDDGMDIDATKTHRISVSALYTNPLLIGQTSILWTFTVEQGEAIVDAKPYQTLGMLEVYNRGFYGYNPNKEATVTNREGEEFVCVA
ncbi:hypothetical protein COB52_05225 [Candidatus Kaiserbacteria bacterium]|nr:MAG: hypothetical protein COB52_05225 [Candidatus Kaiserbacteria bacterium]